MQLLELDFLRQLRERVDSFLPPRSATLVNLSFQCFVDVGVSDELRGILCNLSFQTSCLLRILRGKDS